MSDWICELCREKYMNDGFWTGVLVGGTVGFLAALVAAPWIFVWVFGG